MLRSDKEKKTDKPVIPSKKTEEPKDDESFQAVAWLILSKVYDEKNKKLLMQHREHELSLSLCIAQLASKNLLNKSNYEFLISHVKYSPRLMVAFHELDKKNILTQDTSLFLCTHAKDASTMAVDIILLNNKEKWSVEMIDLLKKNSLYANNLLRRFSILSEANCLEKIKLETIARYPKQKDDSIVIAMIELNLKNLLTDENMNMIFENSTSIRAVLFEIIATKPSMQDELNNLMEKHKLLQKAESEKISPPTASIATTGMFAPPTQQEDSVTSAVKKLSLKGQ